jgi:hypothetical protein
MTKPKIEIGSDTWNLNNLNFVDLNIAAGDRTAWGFAIGYTQACIDNGITTASKQDIEKYLRAGWKHAKRWLKDMRNPNWKTMPPDFGSYWKKKNAATGRS